ncbi:hypothetical protein BKE30_13985 [Alkanindiges hydrocarboniclasticus]|uniref:Uncharacterized protein n=1 Tax=Alkanindiges hydrocarboniclasticus TaxID=1907941 RepID=A0A1S8CQI4_9GAMM|nr:hypothetical protein [Alkanindiges hydrocarboniclasticus]ONG37670.1 hypothetical protein BKE30_13985 [Alkanindiges hydrocarboniclasticus]
MVTTRFKDSSAKSLINKAVQTGFEEALLKNFNHFVQKSFNVKPKLVMNRSKHAIYGRHLMIGLASRGTNELFISTKTQDRDIHITLNENYGYCFYAADGTAYSYVAYRAYPLVPQDISNAKLAELARCVSFDDAIENIRNSRRDILNKRLMVAYVGYYLRVLGLDTPRVVFDPSEIQRLTVRFDSAFKIATILSEAHSYLVPSFKQH